jgi:hypothetical protein
MDVSEAGFTTGPEGAIHHACVTVQTKMVFFFLVNSFALKSLQQRRSWRLAWGMFLRGTSLSVNNRTKLADRLIKSWLIALACFWSESTSSMTARLILDLEKVTVTHFLCCLLRWAARGWVSTAI